MIDLKRLRCFVAIAEEGHFGRAATRLGMSQPPLSEHIRNLESALGVRLFERNTRNVSVTAEGEALLEHAKKILTDVDACREVVLEARVQGQPTLKIGLLHAHSYTFFPRLLRYHLDRQKQQRVELLEYTTQEQIETLLSGAVELGLVREPVRHPQIKVRRLFTEPYAVAVPNRWRLGEGRSLCVSCLNGKPLISYPSHDARRSTRTLFRDFLQTHDVMPAGSTEVRTMHAALALVAAGQGFAPVPLSQTAMPFSGLTYHPFKQIPPQLSVGIAWRNRGLTDQGRQFVENAVTYFEKWPLPVQN